MAAAEVALADVAAIDAPDAIDVIDAPDDIDAIEAPDDIEDSEDIDDPDGIIDDVDELGRLEEQQVEAHPASVLDAALSPRGQC